MNRSLTSLLAALPALLIGVPAAAGDATRFAIEEDQLLIGFAAPLGEHKQLSGVARSLAGSVQVSPEGAQVKLRLPIASIESGSLITDAALRSLLDAEQFPALELEASAPAPGGNESNLVFSGTLRMHGSAVPVKLPVKVLRDGRLAFVHGIFPISLRAFGLNAPSVGGLALGDKVEVSIDARLHTLPEGQAVASF